MKLSNVANLGGLMKEGLLLAASLALGSTLAAAAEPIAVLSMYSEEALPRIVGAGAAQPSLEKVPVYIGQYGIKRAHADAAHALPNGRYAPIFVPKKGSYSERRLSAAEKARLSEAEKTFDGPIPADLLSSSHEQQRLWGLELGRRMRDNIRTQQCAGIRIDSWQFDEVSPTPATKLTPRGVASRWYVSGILHGLAYGRPKLGDKRMQGLVFVSGPGGFGDLPDTEDTRILFWELDHVALAILGEEYPVFRGDAKLAAQHWAHGQLALRAAGGVRARLASRYVAMLTPGYNVWSEQGKWTHLNGNVDGKDDSWVDEWRDAFVSERARIGVAGFGEYNFARNNARKEVVRGAAAAVARGISLLLRRLDPAAVARGAGQPSGEL